MISSLCVLLCFSALVLNGSMTTAKLTYKAGVFEHDNPSSENKSLDYIIKESVEVYEEQILIAASQNVDIIVFPEYGITGLSIPNTRAGLKPYLQVLPSIIPNSDIPWNPCLQSSEESFHFMVLKQLSCSALTNGIIVVANMPTMVKCDKSTSNSCPNDGYYQFNSDIVFSSNGTILATYHKVNLYLEPTFDQPPYPQDYVSTFEAFSVTFGLITCFDILFKYPLITMVHDKSIKNIVMPTAWVDGLPYLTSIQSQEAWAIGLNINLIAANLKQSKDGYRGSGIYSGYLGYINYTYDAVDNDKLITSEVPISYNVEVPRIQVKNVSDNVVYDGIIYDNLTSYSFLKLNANQSNSLSGAITLQTGNITCSADYQFDKPIDHGDYFLAAYQGQITLGYETYVLAVEVCSLMWCSDPKDPINTCSKTSSNFHSASLLKIKLSAQFSTEFVYPNILRSDLQLVDKAGWDFFNVQNSSVDFCSPRNFEQQNDVSLQTKKGFSEKVLVASLYGRLYDLDNASLE